MIDTDTLGKLGDELARHGITTNHIMDCLNNNPSGINTIVSILQTDTYRHERLVYAIISNAASLRTIRTWLAHQKNLPLSNQVMFAFRTSLREVVCGALMGCSEAYVQGISSALGETHRLREHKTYVPDDVFLRDQGVSLTQLAEAVQRHLDQLNAVKAAYLEQYPGTPKLSELQGDPFDNKILGMLERNGFTHLAELTQFTAAEIRSLRQIGDKSIEVLVEELAKYNLTFKSA